MPLAPTPYPVNPIGAGLEGFAGILPFILGLRHMQAKKAFEDQQVGSVLGYPTGATIPSPDPAMDHGPTVPISSPTTGPDGTMTAVAPPSTYPTAPPAVRPMLSSTVGNMGKLDVALGKNRVMSNLMTGLGIGGGQADAMQLEMGPDGTFRIRPGTAAVSSRNANVILRQKDLSNKANLQGWRDAVEKRLARGQLSREESLALRADSDLLNLMVSPQFDLMDDAIKTQLQSQATAAINRLQQRGVKVYTGTRAPKSTPAPATPKVAPVVDINAQRMARYNVLKTQNPSLTDDQIAAQIAMEEHSQGQ